MGAGILKQRIKPRGNQLGIPKLPCLRVGIKEGPIQDFGFQGSSVLELTRITIGAWI